jgi:Fe-S-cluster containining protein
MSDGDVTEDQPLPAGGFSAWLVGMQRALRGEGGSVVPCGGCTACCTSSQFIHIGPDEAETLVRIPAELLFPAPRMPRGNVLLGYDEKGHCPMLIDGECSIYEHRPRTCRTYDCRVFPAAGVELDDEDQLAIAQRARRWRFGFPAEVDQIEHDAVRAAARFVGEHDELLPEDVVPANATQRAVLAIRLHDAFLRNEDETDRSVVVDPEPETIRAIVTSRFSPRPFRSSVR